MKAQISLSFFAISSVFFLFISDLILRFNSFLGESNGSTILILALNVLALLFFLVITYKNPWKDHLPLKALFIIKIYILWCLASFVHGAFSVEGYFEWKRLLLNYLPSILIPLSLALVLNETVSTSVFRFVSTIIFALSFLALPITFSYDAEMLSRALMLITLFLLFIPYVSFKWKLFFISLALLSVLMSFDYRINVIKIFFALILSLMVYRELFLRNSWLNFAMLVSFFTPLVLLLLGILDIYNIFRDGLDFDYEYTAVLGGSDFETNLGADTRTFLFQEVFSSMIHKDSCFLIGEGGGAGYLTVFFTDAIMTPSGRAGSEVGFLNQLLYSGVIGVALYALVIFTAAYYGINKTNNFLTKMLALFLAFHWLLFFLEDRVWFNMNNLSIWLAIGMSLSTKFRSYTDKELEYFFKNSLAVWRIRWK